MAPSEFDDDESHSSAVLRMHSFGGVPVEEVQLLLGAVLLAYNSIYLFDAITRQMELRDIKIRDPRSDYPFLVYRARSGTLYASPIPLNSYSVPLENPGDMIPADSQLLLKRASLHSPGFLDFLGKLNPLEVMRLYLHDRHERRKDREYREYHENEKMRLENELLRNEVFAGRLELLKGIGISEDELARLKNRLLHSPLDALGAVQDRGLIGAVEIIQPDTKTGEIEQNRGHDL
jgi:hypothetical protein